MLASVDGVQLSAQAFRAFLDVARAPGYRPATRAEAVRLLRARLGLLALDAVLAKREEGELTSTALLEELLTARGAGSRQDVFDDLLAQARVEVDHAGLLAFVRQEPTGAPPMPPGYAR